MTFETSLVPRAPEAFSGPILVAVVPQGALPPSLAGLDRVLGGPLSRLYGSGDFSGKRDETALVYGSDLIHRVLLVGVGKPAEGARAAVRRGAAIGLKRARAVGVESAGLWCAPEGRGDAGVRGTFQALVEGAAQGTWHFTEMKRPPEEPKPVLARVDVLAADGEWTEAEAGHRQGAAVAAGHLFARGIQVLPPNVCNPAYLAEVAGQLARRYGFEITVLDRAAMEGEGLRAVLAVGQGSSQEPRFIVLRYSGAAGAARGGGGGAGGGAPVVLVGKGITFDSGGISIKPAQSMEDMKYDMSGAAAVLGTFEMLGRLRPDIEVVGLIPSAENMPGPAAYRPADVVKSHLGKTIEVVNTDAEGRLLLADALSYARRFQPACVIDIATLTGAITICLGPVASGVMGTDPALVQEVIAAGQRANERAWELPLWDDFKDLIKSDIADVKNSGGRPAGSITAGWFLREFVEGFPWAHLDIAGTAYIERENPTMVRGPTGVGVRLFSELILGRAGG
jgi:leucyl aminopeptidase